jgi:5-methylcytosine-specific restriction endonuclease McrA
MSMSENALGKADSVTLVEHKDISECPTCERDDFASRRGILRHHAVTHGCKIRVRLNCDFCGSVFCRKPSHVDDSRFCSKDCKDEWESKNLSGDNAHAWKGKVDIECQSCGEVFQVRKHRESRARFCSKDCRYNWLSNQTGEQNPLYDSVENECEVCGSNYEVAKNRANESRFCSHECYHQWQRQAKEEHPAWKGGHHRDYGGRYKRQRPKALDRDNHTCQDCGATENLHVHHIKPVRTFDDPNDAHDLENLITLCEHCHLSKWENIPLRIDNR